MLTYTKAQPKTAVETLQQVFGVYNIVIRQYVLVLKLFSGTCCDYIHMPLENSLQSCIKFVRAASTLSQTLLSIAFEDQWQGCKL